MTLVDQALLRSIALLRRAVLPEGFVASPVLGHYAGVWARDAAMACMGAAMSGEEDLLDATEATLRSLAGLTGDRGQVPNAYWPERGYWDWGEAGVVDATPWFVLALVHYVERTGRTALAGELWPTVVRCMQWLAHRDTTGTRLVDSPAGGDWMDSSLNRSGRVFHVNVLASWAASGAAGLGARLGLPTVQSIAPVAAVHGLFWPAPGADLADLQVDAAHPLGADLRFPHPLSSSEYGRLSRDDRRHFLASVSYGKFVDRCDVLAHCLAIAGGVARGERARIVLDYLDDTACAEPFPSRTWPTPFEPGDPGGLLDEHADGLQDPRWRNPPGSYHNGAVWPYIGGVHAVAAAVAGRSDRAAQLLEGVAAANRLGDPAWGFHEWIRVPDGSPGGARDQVWNAGAFVWAYRTISDGTAASAAQV
ncbi:MAG: hypothetical protein ACE5GC_03780 [Acidimicrobiia bacterium]